jgi:choline dehydrogenase-like flavoprotein
VSYLPYAIERGTTVLTNARVDRVVMHGDRATAVTGRFREAGAANAATTFRIRARKAVIVAASAIETPLLLARSGVRSAHLGAHFQGHPGASVIGVFDEPVNMWSGATQGFESDEHRIEGGFKIEPVALPPELVFASLPGVGPRWLDNIARSSNLALWSVPIRAEAHGTVRSGRLGTAVKYDLGLNDMTRLRKGLRFAAELLFAAGAHEVMPNVYGLPEVLTRSADAALLENGPANPAAYVFAMTHLFGTARMSVRPGDGVVRPGFGVHGTRDLYVVDSSVFPTNLGVNPQLPIMGIAMHAAKGLAARHG